MDWDELEKKYNNFKPYAPLGKYTVQVTKVDFKKVPSGAIALQFYFADSKDYKFPRSATHWISFGNWDWTRWNERCIMMALGAREEDAKKVVDSATKEESNEGKAKFLERAYKKLLEKMPEAEIEVREQRNQEGFLVTNDEGKPYTESEFTDPKVYQTQVIAEKKDEPEYVPEGGEEVVPEEIDDESIPF